MNLLIRSLSALLLASTACSPEYTYVPVTNSSAIVAGRPAADYQVKSPTSSAGELRLASFGIVTVHRHAAANIPALEVRMVVSNDGDGPWKLDTREQHVELADGSQSPPLAPLDGDSPPRIVRIDPGARETIDLFFPLPPTVQDARSLPAFDVLWTIDTGSRRVEHRTRFDRRAVAPVEDDSSRWQKYAM